MHFVTYVLSDTACMYVYVLSEQTRGIDPMLF